MKWEHEGLRHPFQFSRAMLAADMYVPESELWAREILKHRIEHDRDRAGAIEAGWTLCPVEYIEIEDDDEVEGRLGEWRSRILSREPVVV